jgi:hypothetical protein
MKTLADVVLDYLWFINFASDEQLDNDTAVKLGESVSYDIEHELSDKEKEELKIAAANRLKWWLREPDEHGYTPRKLLTPEQKEFLESIAAGRFRGEPADEDDSAPARGGLD